MHAYQRRSVVLRFALYRGGKASVFVQEAQIVEKMVDGDSQVLFQDPTGNYKTDALCGLCHSSDNNTECVI